MVGAANLADKLLIDVALPLDFSVGMPPQFLVAGTDSLGEQIQRAVPDARVVKTLNTVFVEVMIQPHRVPGHHNLFVCGNDMEATRTARQLLAEFGWPEDAVIDLGDISATRATEMYMQLFFTLVGVLGSFHFNIAVVQGR